MKFGRVEGIVEPLPEDPTYLRLTVILETSGSFTVVRTESVIRLSGEREADLTWQADQYTQETIGVDLALEGWEVIGQGDIPESQPDEIARSATYAVRKL